MRFGVVSRLQLSVAAVLMAGAVPAAGLCQTADAMLMGAAYRQSDLSPLGPGLTSLQFVPGRGLVRWSGAEAPPPSALAGLRPPEPDVERFSPGGLSPYVRYGASGADNHYMELGVSAPLKLNSRARVLKALGIGDGRALGDQARWFVFAAAGGRALSYGYLQESGGGLWALERGGFVGQAQGGVAWRRGSYQSTFSYYRQEIRVDLFGAEDVGENRIAFTVTRFTGMPARPSPGRAFTGKSALAPPDD